METILAIEDSALVQEQLRDILEERYRLRVCPDGPAGIGQARQPAPARSREINNPLTSIFGRLQLLQRELARIRVIVDKRAKASRVAKTGYVGDQEMLDRDGI